MDQFIGLIAESKAWFTQYEFVESLNARLSKASSEAPMDCICDLLIIPLLLTYPHAKLSSNYCAHLLKQYIRLHDWQCCVCCGWGLTATSLWSKIRSFPESQNSKFQMDEDWGAVLHFSVGVLVSLFAQLMNPKRKPCSLCSYAAEDVGACLRSCLWQLQWSCMWSN